MRERFRKITAVLLSVVMIALMIPFSIISVSAGTVVETAISWAVSIANDDSHGYSWDGRWGPDYDCSSLVISAFRESGLSLDGATTTVNMKRVFIEEGFTWIPASQIDLSNPNSLCRGDILLNESSHTEIYLGNGQNVGAHRGYMSQWCSHSNTDGKYHRHGHYSLGEQKGDQDGGEISVAGYYNYPWDGVLRYKDEPDNIHNPVSHLDYIIGDTGSVHIKGWTFDRDNLNQSIDIHVYIGGSSATPDAEATVVHANVSRQDMDNEYHVGEFHGFEATIPTSKTGNVDVYIYAINIGEGGNTEIGHQTVTLNSGYNPTTYLDSITGATGCINIKGWTFDRDKLEQSLKIHVYIGGSSATPSAEVTVVDANVSRKDVDNVHHVGEFHGFDATIPTSKTGDVDVYIYAINIGGGGNVEIGHRTVHVFPDTELPGYTSKWINCVTNDSFRVNIVPTDNVGIKKVRVATWTQSNQSDLIWHDAQKYENCYYLDIDRADYSKTQNSFYQNHFYIYDYAGNYCSIACNQDYKITSNTGKNLPEGEYRIVTALDERKAIHVENDSTEDRADIQISSNLSNPNQIFSLEYTNNGFYTIRNSHSGNVLDVWNDTYIIGTNVVSHHYLGGANQEWMFVPTDDGYYAIVAHSNGQALDVRDFKTDDGSTVFVYTLKNPFEINQKWRLLRVIKPDMVKVKSWKLVNSIMKPTVKVSVDDNILIENTDYTVSSYIENNTLYARITGIGNYCDSVLIEYQEPKYEIGDTNLDGNVNVRDVTAIQRHLVELKKFNEEQLALADTNGDGNVDIADATHLQMYLAEYDVVLGKQ